MPGVRRGSLGFGATPKLERRLELRRVFDALDTDGGGTVSLEELQTGIERNPQIAQFFTFREWTTQQVFDKMDKNKDGEIEWDEFMQFVWEVENKTHAVNEADLVLENARSAHGPASRRGTNSSVRPGGAGMSAASGGAGGTGEWDGLGEGDDGREDMVPEQLVALEVDTEHTQGELQVMLLDVDDTRVVMAPENKIMLSSTSEPGAAAREFIRRRGLDPAVFPLLVDHVRRAVLRTVNKELKLIRQAKLECETELESVAKLVMDAEDNIFERREAAKRAEFMQKLTASKSSPSTPGGAVPGGGTVLENFLASLKGPVTPARLATMLAKEEREVEHLEQRLKSLDAEKQARLGRSGSVGDVNDTAAMFEAADVNGDGVIDRSEWRSFIDEKMALVRQSNEERRIIVEENCRLRRALQSMGGNERVEDTLRQHDEERENLSREITTMHMTVSKLEAELKVAIEELEALHASAQGDSAELEEEESDEEGDLEKRSILRNWKAERDQLLATHRAEEHAWQEQRSRLMTHIEELERRRREERASRMGIGSPRGFTLGSRASPGGPQRTLGGGMNGGTPRSTARGGTSAGRFSATSGPRVFP